MDRKIIHVIPDKKKVARPLTFGMLAVGETFTFRPDEVTSVKINYAQSMDVGFSHASDVEGGTLVHEVIGRVTEVEFYVVEYL